MFCSLYFAQQRKFLFTWYVFAVNYTAIELSNDCFVWIAYSLWQLLRNKLHNPFFQHSAILVFSIVIFSTCSKLKKPSLFFWGRFICSMTHVAVAFGCFFFVVVVKTIKKIPRKKLEKVTGITCNNFSPSFGPDSRKSVRSLALLLIITCPLKMTNLFGLNALAI